MLTRNLQLKNEAGSLNYGNSTHKNLSRALDPYVQEYKL